MPYNYLIFWSTVLHNINLKKKHSILYNRLCCSSNVTIKMGWGEVAQIGYIKQVKNKSSLSLRVLCFTQPLNCVYSFKWCSISHWHLCQRNNKATLIISCRCKAGIVDFMQNSEVVFECCSLKGAVLLPCLF